jgi:hypothetical protein
MSRTFTGFRIAVAVLATLGASSAALADGEGQAPFLEAIKDRNARYADFTRAGDPVGDQHEALLLQCAIERYPDLLGDFEEKRIQRAYLNGRRATLHALVAREHDHSGDLRQRVLAKRTTARKSADLRRLRDLTNDKLELAEFNLGRLRHGPNAGGAVGIGKRRDNPEGRLRDEDKNLIRVDQEQDTRRDRDEDEDERTIERENERAQTRKDDEDERGEEADEEAAEAKEERDLERDLERDEERDEEAAEDESERDEEADERDLERDMDAEEEQALQNEEE